MRYKNFVIEARKNNVCFYHKDILECVTKHKIPTCGCNDSRWGFASNVEDAKQRIDGGRYDRHD